MKISRIRHVIITSIIYLIIIGVIIGVYSSTVRMLRENTVDEVYRVVATKDIEPGEEITTDNVECRAMKDALTAENMIYR